MSTARALALRDGIVLHTVRDERTDILAMRATALAGMNKTLDRAERREDGCLTACEEDVVVRSGKYIRKLDADLAQLKAQPTTKGRRRGRLISELRAELHADLRKQDPKPQPQPNRWRARDRRKAAIHEAAHAVAFEARGVPVLSVNLHECAPAKPDAVGALCGSIAAIKAGHDDNHSPGDIAMVRRALRNEGKAEDEMPAVEAQAHALVARSWWMIQRVAAALFESAELTGDQVRGLMSMSAFEVQEQRRYSRQHAYAQEFAW